MVDVEGDELSALEGADIATASMPPCGIDVRSSIAT